ncbi:hypothetical protein D3C77_124100 [compost metagenome]
MVVAPIMAIAQIDGMMRTCILPQGGRPVIQVGRPARVSFQVTELAVQPLQFIPARQVIAIPQAGTVGIGLRPLQQGIGNAVLGARSGIRDAIGIGLRLGQWTGPGLACPINQTIRGATGPRHRQLARVAKSGAILRHRGDGAAAHRHPGRQAGVAADGGDGKVTAAPADRGGHVLSTTIGQSRRGVELLVLPHRDCRCLGSHGQRSHDGVGHRQGHAAGLTADHVGGRDTGVPHAHPGRQPADDGGHPGGIAAPAGGVCDVLSAVVGQLGCRGELHTQPGWHCGRIRRDHHPHHGGIAHRQ